ncbi:MAG: GNAT family N-acetyltransferase [Planctomycetota bacterium]
MGHHSIVARVADHSPASIAVHRACGFREVGVLREAGRKFGRWIDVTLMQRRLPQEL